MGPFGPEKENQNNAALRCAALAWLRPAPTLSASCGLMAPTSGPYRALHVAYLKWWNSLLDVDLNQEITGHTGPSDGPFGPFRWPLNCPSAHLYGQFLREIIKKIMEYFLMLFPTERPSRSAPSTYQMGRKGPPALRANIHVQTTYMGPFGPFNLVDSSWLHAANKRHLRAIRALAAP